MTEDYSSTMLSLQVFFLGNFAPPPLFFKQQYANIRPLNLVYSFSFFSFSFHHFRNKSQMSSKN